MKQFQYKRALIFCAITMIPIIIHILQSYPDATIWKKILTIVVTGAVLFFGSGFAAVLCTLIMYFAGKGMIWLLNEKEEKEPRLESLLYSVWAVLFCIAYYEALTGHAIGVI